MNFDFSLILQSIPKILGGFWLTVGLLLISTGLGLGLGVVLLLMRISRRWYLDGLAQAYIYVFRGTPILVQIYIIYYGLPQFDFIRDNSFLWAVFRDPFACCIVALTLNTGAYQSEILRGGVLGVDRGVQEAGAALGLSSSQIFVYLVSPLAIRLSLPAFGSEMISLLKATALASTITLADMTGIGRSIVSQTFSPYEIFITLAVIYMGITWAIQLGIGAAEAYFGRFVKR